MFKSVIAAVLLYGLIYASIVGTIVYIVWHFISKFW